jgi:hypothetical protein
VSLCFFLLLVKTYAYERFFVMFKFLNFTVVDILNFVASVELKEIHFCGRYEVK